MIAANKIALLALVTTLTGFAVPCRAAQSQAAPKSGPLRMTYDPRVLSAQSPPEADGLGTHLPPGFNKNTLIEQLTDDRNPDYTALVGVVPWPRKPGYYIAIVCAGFTDEQVRIERKAGTAKTCDGTFPEREADDKDKQFNLVFLGLYKLDRAGSPVLIARSHDDYNSVDVGWTDSDLPQPGPADHDADGDHLFTPQVIKRFDLAAYEVRNGDYAFGLRVGWKAGSNDSGMELEALALFEQAGNDIRLIFAQPMGAVSCVAENASAGDSACKDVEIGRKTLVILPSRDNGYRDIEVHGDNGKFRRRFSWSEKENFYVGPTAKVCFAPGDGNAASTRCRK